MEGRERTREGMGAKGSQRSAVPAHPPRRAGLESATAHVLYKHQQVTTIQGTLDKGGPRESGRLALPGAPGDWRRAGVLEASCFCRSRDEVNGASLVPDRQVCEELSGLVLIAGEEATAARTTGERPWATVLSFRRPFPFWKSRCRRRALLLLCTMGSRTRRCNGRLLSSPTPATLVSQGTQRSQHHPSGLSRHVPKPKRPWHLLPAVAAVPRDGSCRIGIIHLIS